MGEQSRVANLLGAVATAVGDRVREAAGRALAHGGETPAAVVALGHAPGLSNDALARVLGLSHPGAVRLVDRLVADGLVERQAVPRDRRAVALWLTVRGRACRSALLAERSAAIEASLDVLTAEEQGRLATLLEKLLGAMPTDPLHGLSICRHCDEAVCAPCPIDAALGLAEPAGPAPA